MNKQPRVLIAGIAGGSLGTEILKCLALAGGYSVFGGDVSSLAYGHYCKGFEETFLVDRKHYLDSILAACRARAIEVIIPGGEEPLTLLSEGRDRFDQAGIQFAGNSAGVIKLYSDKQATFSALAQLGFEIPLTVAATNALVLDNMRYPCVIKPAKGGGGSSSVFLAETRDGAATYINYLLQHDRIPIVQEYIAPDEGEFTIGVLTFPDGTLVGSVALRRMFNSKLSVLLQSKVGVISSGYSQGLIDEFPEFRATAERISLAIGSVGPLNIQGRVRNGIFVPFEINPRFSASTYLRALAGFNEVDIYLQFLINRVRNNPAPLRPGYYLRSLAEVFVGADKVVS